MSPEALSFINFVAGLLCIAIVLRGILSWFDPFERSQPQQYLAKVTDPVLAPFRQIVPAVGGLDFSW